MPDEAESLKRQRKERLNLALVAVGLAVNIIGASVFWISLPERMRSVVSSVADHESRLRALEKTGGEQATTIGRIDERTRSIQESIIEVKQSLRGTK